MEVLNIEKLTPLGAELRRVMSADGSEIQTVPHLAQALEIPEFDAWGLCMAKAMAPEARLTVTVDEHPALEGLSIRELKALASEAKIKRYSNLTKEELIKRLRKAA